MLKPDHVIDIFLQPGDFYFGDRDTRIRTLLGSCVSITMWHPKRLIGGMCHYMLPYRSAQKNTPSQYKLDGRYAEEAMLMFFQEMARHNTNPSEYVVKVFGGGNMFPDHKKRKGSCTLSSIKEKVTICSKEEIMACSKDEIMACSNVACKNISVIDFLAREYGLHVAADHMGGLGHRNIIFDIWSGYVWMRKPAVKDDNV